VNDSTAHADVDGFACLEAAVSIDALSVQIILTQRDGLSTRASASQ
jgi:hypothetical protein